MIIAIDFDGTIVEHRFPEIGKPVPYALDFIRALRDNGHQIFLWTIRSNYALNRFEHDGKIYQRKTECTYLAKAYQFLEENGIILDGYNESPHQLSSSNKQYANYYIDDTALGTPLMADSGGYVCVDWFQLGLILIKNHLITREQYNQIINKTWKKNLTK